jgi:hypothetical protein
MNTATLNRRQFLGTATAGAALTSTMAGSLVLGFPTRAAAQGQAPEVNAWVVVQPDERVIVELRGRRREGAWPAKRMMTLDASRAKRLAGGGPFERPVRRHSGWIVGIG